MDQRYHTIRLGGNFQRAYTNSLRNNARTGLTLGYFTYYTGISGDPIQDEVEQLLLGKADNTNRAFGDTHRHLVQNSLGFYAQDDWKINHDLPLTSVCVGIFTGICAIPTILPPTSCPVAV